MAVVPQREPALTVAEAPGDIRILGDVGLAAAGQPSPASLSGEATVARMFWARVARWSSRVVFRHKRQGVWESVTWEQAGDTVSAIVHGLAAWGFRPGDTAAILANTRREWCCADLAVLSAGGVCVGIYPTVPALQLQEQLQDCAASVLFVEDDEQLDKALEVRASLPRLRRIVVIDPGGLRGFGDPMLVHWATLLEQGAAERAKADILERRLASRDGSDLAIVVFTSGTTGRAKGAMISHGNLMTQLEGGVRLLGQDERDERIAFMPLCHAAERVLGCYYALYAGTATSFVEKPETLVANACEVAPTVFMAVPRIWQKLYSSIMLRLADATPFQRWAYGVAIGFGRRRSQFRLLGARVSPGLRLLGWLAYVLVLRNIRVMIGIDRCRMLITGAAPISRELTEWYLALGVDMLEVYGQTECSGLISLMPAAGIRPGTVGKPMPFHALRISPHGEVQVKGASIFMGYLNRPAGDTPVENGWLGTGDLGALDEQGYLSITGRIKDILITAGGKNVTPSLIENELKFSPYIADVVVVGEGRKYLTCLVMPDHDNIAHYAQARNVAFTDFADLCRNAAVQQLIWQEIERVNAGLSRAEALKKFRLIDRKLGADDEEMTPTLKLKRAVVAVRYQALIDEMYADA
jgi:long-chain acyl-CoA synthetase